VCTFISPLFRADTHVLTFLFERLSRQNAVICERIPILAEKRLRRDRKHSKLYSSVMFLSGQAYRKSLQRGVLSVTATISAISRKKRRVFLLFVWPGVVEHTIHALRLCLSLLLFSVAQRVQSILYHNNGGIQ